MSAFIKIEVLGQEHFEDINEETFYYGNYRSMGSDIPTSGTKAKRVRTKFTDEQKAVLLRSFKIDKFPSRTDRSILAEALGLPPKTVKIWFQNQRIKIKKDSATPIPPKMDDNIMENIKKEDDSLDNQVSNMTETPSADSSSCCKNDICDYDSKPAYSPPQSLQVSHQDTNCFTYQNGHKESAIFNDFRQQHPEYLPFSIQNVLVSHPAFSMNFPQNGPSADIYKDHYKAIHEQRSQHPHCEYMPKPPCSPAQYFHAPEKEPVGSLTQEEPTAVDSFRNIPNPTYFPTLYSRVPQQRTPMELRQDVLRPDQTPSMRLIRREPIDAGSNPINNRNCDYISQHLHSTTEYLQVHEPQEGPIDSDSDTDDQEDTHFHAQDSQNGLKVDQALSMKLTQRGAIVVESNHLINDKYECISPPPCSATKNLHEGSIVRDSNIDKQEQTYFYAQDSQDGLGLDQGPSMRPTRRGTIIVDGCNAINNDYYEYFSRPTYSSTVLQVAEQEPLVMLPKKEPIVSDACSFIKCNFEYTAPAYSAARHSQAPDAGPSVILTQEKPIVANSSININNPYFTNFFPQQTSLMGLTQNTLSLDVADKAFSNVFNHIKELSDFPSDLAVS